MYICQICKKAPATIHLTDIHNNVKKEVHICESCASEKGFNLSGAANLPQLLGLAAKKVMPSVHKSASVKVRTAERELVCPHCGTTWAQFGERGRLGCPEDYTVFAEKLRPLIAGQISGAKEPAAFHVGKRPGEKPDGGEERQQRLHALQQKLQQAIAEENYEAAAKLKTGIDELRKNGEGQVRWE